MERQAQHVLNHGFLLPFYLSEKLRYSILLFTVFVQLFIFIANRTDYTVYFTTWTSLLRISFGLIILGCWTLILPIRRSVRSYGLKRNLLSWLFITVISCILVVVLDQTEVWAWNKLELVWIKKLEENVVIINETRPEFRIREIRAYAPYKVEKHSRYNGEDLRLVCENTLYFKEKVRWHHQQVIWKHNQERVESSDRYHIKTIFEELPDNETIRKMSELYNVELHMYHVESTLEIYLIDDRDYGKYSCHIAKRALRLEEPKEKGPSLEPDKRDECPQQEPSENSKNECPCILNLDLDLDLEFRRVVPYEWNSEFIVSQILPMKRVVSVPMGSIISASASYMHIDDTPVEFNHEINGKSFVDICERYKQKCSILIYTYWLFWHNGGHYSNIPAFDKRLQMVEGVGGTSWQCVCPYTYGTHKFVFRREFFNRTMGMYQTIEIPYPDVAELVPREPNILPPYDNVTKEPLPLPEQTCWGIFFKDLICKYLERILNDMASEFFANERRVIFSWIVHFIVGTLLLSVIITSFIKPVVFVILKKGIQPLESARTLAGLETDNTNIHYDLFISCDEEQAGIAAQIATYLQSHGLRVCLSDVDILGSEIILQGISRLVAKSRKYLVIVTSEYVQNRLLNNFEFLLILQQFHNGIDSRNIALLEMAPNLIPSVFHHFVIFRCLGGMDCFNISLLKEWHGPSLFGTEAHLSVMESMWSQLRCLFFVFVGCFLVFRYIL